MIAPLSMRGDGGEGGAMPVAGLMGNVVAGRGESSDAMFSQLFLMQQRVEDLRNKISASFVESRHHIKQVNANLKRINIVPAARHKRSNNGDNEQHDEPGGGDIARPVSMQKLSKRPGDLYVLWREYSLGLNGGKPARDYTWSERGANRCAYSRRKNFWNAICSLMTKGYSADTAIDRVYEVYQKSQCVSVILDAIIADKQACIERF